MFNLDAIISNIDLLFSWFGNVDAQLLELYLRTTNIMIVLGFVALLLVGEMISTSLYKHKTNKRISELEERLKVLEKEKEGDLIG